MMRLVQVSKDFDGKPILTDFSFSFAADRSYLLTGPSGAGKTTLLRLLAGLERPDRGQILRPEPLRLRMVFQEDRLLPQLTVLQNVRLETGTEEKARALLAGLELDGEAEALPDTLSGGMKRRAAIARALCAEPDVLLLDEPFNGLDEALRRKTAALIFGEMRGKCVVCATHYPEEIRAYADEFLEIRPFADDSPQCG